MKIQGRHRDKPHFEGAMRNTTATCEMVSESQNFKIHKATPLFLLKYICWSLCWRVSHLQQSKAMYVGAGWRNRIKIAEYMIQEAYS